MKKIFLFTLIFFAIKSYSQNYDLVIPDKVNYFYDFKDFVHEFRIDSSFVLNNDTIYTSFTRVREFDSCYAVLDASIFGKAIIKNTQNDWKIVNAEFDTLLIKSNANLNETWNCFSASNNEYIEAKCSNITYKIINANVQDSVKTISFKLKNSISGNEIANEINNVYIEISKKNGIISMPDFAIFPFIEIHVNSSNLNWKEPNAFSQLNLESISPINHIRPELKYSYYFNYEVGDIYQTLTEIERGSSINGTKSFTDIYKTYTVVYKEETALSFEYTLDIEELEKNYDIYGGGVDYYSETSKFVSVPKDSFFFKESFFENQYLEEKPTYALQKNELEKLYSFNLVYDSGYFYLNEWNKCSYSKKEAYYIKGIGGPFKGFGSSNPDEFTRGQTNLIYYKKENQEWGLFFNSIKQVENESKLINIFPNPNSGKFQLEFENNSLKYTITVKNILGEKFLEIATQKDFLNLDLNLDLNLVKGLNFIEINQGTRTFTNKFIVH